MNVFLLMLAKVYIQHIKFNAFKLQQISETLFIKTQLFTPNHLIVKY